MASLLQTDALFALRPAVRALVAHVLGARPSDADVEDCTSEAFRRALEGEARLHDGAPLRPWVLGIAHHVALDARRARVRARSRSAPALDRDEPGDALELLHDRGPDPHEQAEQRERRHQLQAAMSVLPDEQRRALFLCAQGLGYREIASELSVPIGTVCTWIARARQQLARTLKDESAEPF
ncbi:MAG TPA: sigma-70 family RNA polymerase sigma factor [Polyangiales bacterium]|jgi:RNA polymerase sigma-70 factor (ECF subfamily)|nr:sigma-70 family RNA polymerase sigma factor [Polyangiales bacterium]